LLVTAGENLVAHAKPHPVWRISLYVEGEACDEPDAFASTADASVESLITVVRSMARLDLARTLYVEG